MLETLSKVDGLLAREVLAAVSSKILSPEFRSSPVMDIKPAEAQLIDATLAEVSDRAKRTSGKGDVISAMLDIVSNEISRLIFAQTDKDAVRVRLGNAGRLPNSLYKVIFSPKFKANESFHCVREAHVISAISNADSSEHFSALIEGNVGQPFASLFAQVPPTKASEYTLLVHAGRVGDSLFIEDAWRVYHDEIHVDRADTPLIVLRKFLEKFGSNEVIEVDSKVVCGPQKLIHEEIVRVPNGSTLVLKREGQVLAKIERSGLTSVDDDRIEITLDYGVLINPYIEYLARHKLKAERPKVAVSSTLRGLEPLRSAHT